MRMRVTEVVVGLFMLAGMAALLLLALNVSGLSLSSGKDTYRVYAHFDNIGGLTARSKVTLSGVHIGEVTDIYLDQDELRAKIVMEIHNDVDYLSLDSSASILTAGLLGEKYIGIDLGAEDDYLIDGDTIYDTQSALVLENLIGKFLFNQAGD